MSNSKSKKHEVRELTSAEILKGWNVKHPNCSVCGKSDKKRYSGSTCSTCYTKARNERLGIGTDSPENRAKKLDKLNNKIRETEMLLEALRSELETLSKES